MERPIAGAYGRLRTADPDSVRSFVAQWWLTGTDISATAPDTAALGEITLRPHQFSAVGRIGDAIAEFGGALLCDEVGMGKTFIALAVARRSQRIAVVAPASLEDMWQKAAGQAGMTVAFTSFERLSRKKSQSSHFDFLIVDEAHHARNAAAARYGQLSALATDTPTLLLSATPIHNRRSDLASLLALFLGSRADLMTGIELSRCVIRRGRAVVDAHDGLPLTEPAEWCQVSHDEALPASLLALPPPLPPRDGGDGGVLIARSLIRQWASSDAALMGGLRRRLQKSMALIAGLENGVFPSGSDLLAWAAGEDSMQMAFPELIAPAVESPAELLVVARTHREALLDVYRSRNKVQALDLERVAILSQIAARHAGLKVVAFSQYADTVNGLFRVLADRGEVAALTARGATVAGGMISRREALDRFAPRARGVAPPRTADRISFLLTTDLLSEGVNLQDAGVVVHLDIPWTPARLAQRVGRCARLGSEHHRVWSYAMKPPASAEALLRIENIIERKLLIARAAVGEALPMLPRSDALAPDSQASDPGDLLAPPMLGEAIRQALSNWMGTNHRSADVASAKPPTPLPTGSTLVTAVAALGPDSGFLAACVLDGRRVLLSSTSGRVTGDLRCVLNMLEHPATAWVPISQSCLSDALLALHLHFRTRDAMRGITSEAVSVTQARTALLRRISAAASHARPHLRGQTMALAQRARSVVLRHYGIASETAMCRLVLSELNDEDWLQSIEAFGTVHARTAARCDDRGARIVALLLWQPGSDT